MLAAKKFVVKVVLPWNLELYSKEKLDIHACVFYCAVAAELIRKFHSGLCRWAWSIEFHHLIANNKKEIRIQTPVKMASPNFSLITKCFLVVLLSIALVILNSGKINLLISVIFDTLRKKKNKHNISNSTFFYIWLI